MKIPLFKNPIFLFLIFFTPVLGAQPVGWTHLQPIHITENSGITLTDYQIRLSINTQALISAGQLQADGDDLRFGNDCQGSGFFQYWIESGLNTTNTLVWVRVDSLPASQQRDIFMYFGNPAATGASAIAGTFDGPFSTIDSLALGNSSVADSSQYGFRFMAAEDILVTDFGKHEPTGNTRYITLFDYNSQAILRQMQVSGPAAVYNYAALASPIWLTTGTLYVVEIYQELNDGYYYGNFNQAGQHIIYYDMLYCNSCTQNTFPTNSLPENQYGYPDMLYYTKKSAFTPPTTNLGTIDQPFIFDAGTTVNGSCYTPNYTIGNSASGSGSFTYNWAPGSSLSDNTVASPIASPTVTTTYTATVTSSLTGCAVIDSVTVTIPAPPAITITAPSASTCIGTAINLTGNGGSTYDWQPVNLTSSTISVIPTTSTTYTVTGTDAATGCSSSAQYTVGVLPLPTITIAGNTAVCIGSSVSLTATGGGSYVWNTGDTIATAIVSPTSPTTYTVTGTDAFGCTNTATQAISINTLPVVTVSGSSQVCENTPVTLNATGASTYVWQPSSSTGSTFTFSASVTTTITVFGTDLVGCSDSTTYIVNVDTVPPVQISAPISSLCVDDAVLQLNGSPLTGVFSGIGVSDNEFDPLVTGTGTFTAYYSYTHTNGCSMTDSMQITVNACLGIANQNDNTVLQVYPNPVTDLLVISGQLVEESAIYLYDSFGKLVAYQTSLSNQTSLNTSELQNGVYLLQIIRPSGDLTSHKILINR